MKAALQQFAAEIELATPATENWNVELEDYYDIRGACTLELTDATPAEVVRWMALLEKLTK